MKYLLAYSIPLITIIGIKLGNLYTFMAFLYAFVIIPIMEIIIDKSKMKSKTNKTDNKTTNLLFDILLYLNLPIVYSIMIYTLLQVSTTYLSTTELIGSTLSIGVMLGANGINVAHELGHRTKLYEKTIAKLLLLPSYYTHFYIEHNHGHHLNVATPKDASTAKLNQNVYAFWIQSVVGTYIKAWQIQTQLNKNNQLPFINMKNDMLWLTILKLTFGLSIYFILGTKALIFSILSGIVGFLLLETINYIEHYGLLRKKTTTGRYERVTEQHSWNSDFVLGRLVLYELTRHSDHHFKSTKKYQTLENHNTSPQLAFGYPTSMVIAFFPPLWFHIMNKRIPIQ